jgi:4-hydroxy-tetrahydrodipicolinate synthase
MALGRSHAVSIRGNVPAVVTPFTEAGELMLDAFAELVLWHVDNGVDGICVAGDNGEAWALTPDERRALAETAVREVRGRVPVAVGASAITARQTIALAEIAAAAGADAIMLQPQAYVLKAGTREIANRYKCVAEAVAIPILAYNSPRRTGLNMDLATLDAICDVAPIVALKEASRDFFHTTHVIERFARRFSVMMGPGPFIIPGVALGAAGFISSGPELLGPAARRIMALATAAPTEESRQLHFTVSIVYETLMDAGIWPAALKAALNMVGQPAGWPREPVSPLAPDAIRKLRTALQDLEVVPVGSA